MGAVTPVGFMSVPGGEEEDNAGQGGPAAGKAGRKGLYWKPPGWLQAPKSP